MLQMYLVYKLNIYLSQNNTELQHEQLPRFTSEQRRKTHNYNMHLIKVFIGMLFGLNLLIYKSSTDFCHSQMGKSHQKIHIRL